MTLTKQLEDKKKGCGIRVNVDNSDESFGGWQCGQYYDSFKRIYYCKRCKEIIAILEQAIAEIKKRDKDIDELAESSTFALCALIKENKDLKDEMQNIQSQQNTNTTSTNSTWKLCEGELEHFKSKDNDPNNDKQRAEVETGSADTPQEKISEVRIKALFPNIEKSPVVSNLQFPELEPKKCFSDGFDKGVQFGMQKQRQEILKLIKQEISKDAYSYTFECRLNDFLKNGLKKQLNQLKEEQ